ncbi:MAG TPA: HAD family hydrolase [Bacteroidales bacterium]|nr:HAD family hydrolase [Bacteroidales bacterium]
MPNKAVFLDRDGVINRERGEYTWRKEDFTINEGVFEFLSYAQKKGYLLIIISNQGGIQRGKYSLKDVEIVHQYLKDELSKHGIHLSDIYICPHHDKTERCFCRKPQPIMLEKAIARFKIDVNQSFFFGDSKRDMEAGNSVGVKSILIEPNTSLLNHLSVLD